MRNERNDCLCVRHGSAARLRGGVAILFLLTLSAGVCGYASNSPLQDGANVNTPENFPDANFRGAIESFMDVDAGGFFTAADALVCSNLEIESLEGIGYFENLYSFQCSSNQLTNLDLSGNPALIGISCGENQLTDLDVSGNPALELCECSSNQLTDLILSSNESSLSLDCKNNQLSSLSGFAYSLQNGIDPFELDTAILHWRRF